MEIAQGLDEGKVGRVSGKEFSCHVGAGSEDGEGLASWAGADGSALLDLHRQPLLARPMSCMPGYFEVINTHTVGSLTIPRASFKWV